MKWTHKIDALECAKCGGRREIIALIPSSGCRGPHGVQVNALSHQSVPGLHIDLPAWPRDGHFGKYREANLHLRSPLNTHDNIKLLWGTNAGGENSPDDPIHKALKLSALIQDPTPIQVGGGVAERRTRANVVGNSVQILWKCPEDHRTLILLVTRELGASQLADFSTRIARSVQCHSEGRVAVEKLQTRPRTAPSEGWQMSSTNRVDKYLGPNGEQMAVDDGRQGNYLVFDSPDAETRYAAGLLEMAGGHPVANVIRRLLRDELGQEHTVWEEPKTVRAEILRIKIKQPAFSSPAPAPSAAPAPAAQAPKESGT